MSETANPLSNLPAVPASGSDAPRGLSDASRLIDTFVAPSKTFADIRRSSRWWLPFLLTVLFAYIFVYAVEKQVGWPQVIENVLKQSPKQQERFADMEPIQATQARKQMATGYRSFAFGSPVLTLLFAAISSAVLLATVNFGFGGDATFGRMFCLWMYASLPITLKSVLAAITLFAGIEPASFNLQNPVGTNLGFYLPADFNKGILTMASSVDVLTIWTAFLLILGCSIVANIKRSHAAIAVIGWWVIIILASTAGAIVQS